MKMPRQPWFLDVLADEFRGAKGFRVDVYPGWEKRGTTSFDPEGVMDHHTGAGAYNNLLKYMAVGPIHPPLCNYATSRPDNGVVRVTIVAAGRANHAGVGELPWRRGQGSTGNMRTFGAEHQNDGRQSWPSQQVEAIRRCDAALLSYMRMPVERLLDHKTYAPKRKWDRHSTDVAYERRIVKSLLEGDELTPDEKRMLKAVYRQLCEGRDAPDEGTSATIRTRTWQSNAALGRIEPQVDEVHHEVTQGGDSDTPPPKSARTLRDRVFQNNNALGRLAKKLGV
ncbi:MAG: N-acetylmuramoyl-L-alanine amidase [Actinobacteria bacterium]|nr:N-acetylmuramoyl-L-alanine amidase [Actinomycetota bacterium]